MPEPETPVFISPGAEVRDANGEIIGAVRAVYPHFIAVDSFDRAVPAYRVPIASVERVEPGQLTLSVPRASLDPMSGADAAFDHLPERGAVVDTPIGDARVPDLREPDAVAVEPALADAARRPESGADID